MSKDHSQEALIASLEAKIEQLRFEISEFQRARDVSLKSHLEHITEIERQANSIMEAMTQLAFKDAEIEQLRGLLRECLPYVAAPTGSGGDIWRRVTKALGEKNDSKNT